jgi:hypothetical protein
LEEPAKKPGFFLKSKVAISKSDTLKSPQYNRKGGKEERLYPKSDFPAGILKLPPLQTTWPFEAVPNLQFLEQLP